MTKIFLRCSYGSSFLRKNPASHDNIESFFYNIYHEAEVKFTQVKVYHKNFIHKISASNIIY